MPPWSVPTAAILAAALAGAAAAQGNTVAGLDGRLTDVGAPTVWGRSGAPFPGGRLGMSVATSVCNPGTVPLPWFGAMLEDHPKLAFLLARLADDRLVQISDRSFCKHAAVAFNNATGPCLPCANPTPGNQLGPGCSDVYAAGGNGDRFWLGPADEIDPWLGTWHAIGSYFDRGDPDVGPPADRDGVRSLNLPVFDEVAHRIVVQEADLLVAGAQYFCQAQLVHQGEDVSRRGDNVASRGVVFAWDGQAWSATGTGALATGTVLGRWPGAAVALGGNGPDDGRFAVAVKVTSPQAGWWHYEYAVHDLDNQRGAASFRVPLCPAARVRATGFRDIDDNALDEWPATRSGGELAFTAPAGNALDWNTIYDFWFDSDAAPVAGSVRLDQARIGAGAFDVAVPSQVPGFVPNVWLGEGCGAPAVTLTANGVATIPNPAFALRIDAAPATFVAAFFSWDPAQVRLPSGCTSWLDLAVVGAYPPVLTDAAGAAVLALAIPATLAPGRIDFQVLSLTAGGALFGSYDLSNGLEVRIGRQGCP